MDGDRPRGGIDAGGVPAPPPTPVAVPRADLRAGSDSSAGAGQPSPPVDMLSETADAPAPESPVPPAVPVVPMNINVDIRILSPGDDGDVTQVIDRVRRWPVAPVGGGAPGERALHMELEVDLDHVRGWRQPPAGHGVELLGVGLRQPRRRQPTCPCSISSTLRWSRCSTPVGGRPPWGGGPGGPARVRRSPACPECAPALHSLARLSLAEDRP